MVAPAVVLLFTPVVVDVVPAVLVAVWLAAAVVEVALAVVVVVATVAMVVVVVDVVTAAGVHVTADVAGGEGAGDVRKIDCRELLPTTRKTAHNY